VSTLVSFHPMWGWFSVSCTSEGAARITLPTFQEKPTEGQGVAVDLAQDLIQRLHSYLDGEAVSFADCPLDLRGLSSFAREVLAACRDIPYGEVRSYGQLARLVGSPRACRAVGRVMAQNPLPLIVPCHRVVGASGSLTGFGGGLELKRRLLALEGVDVDMLGHRKGD
jgi:methylated-DNA-[protein]-cysteine S-methyltransferase